MQYLFMREFILKINSNERLNYVMLLIKNIKNKFYTANHDKE